MASFKNDFIPSTFRTMSPCMQHTTGSGLTSVLRSQSSLNSQCLFAFLRDDPHTDLMWEIAILYIVHFYPNLTTRSFLEFGLPSPEFIHVKLFIPDTHETLFSSSFTRQTKHARNARWTFIPFFDTTVTTYLFASKWLLQSYQYPIIVVQRQE